MSIKIMTRVWDISQAEGAKLLVLLALADRADEEGYCYPSVAYLARKSRVSERQVQNLLRDLEEEGEIQVEKRAGRGHSNLYRVMVGLEKMKCSTPIPGGKGEAQRTEKVKPDGEKVKPSAEKVKSDPGLISPNPLIKDSKVKDSSKDSSLSEEETEKLTKRELEALEGIGVYQGLIPEVTRIVFEKDIDSDTLLELVRYARDRDQQGTPGALFMTRLRRYKPAEERRKTAEEWLEVPA